MARTLYPGSARFSTETGDRTTRHSFAFGPHYDPTNLGFGPLLCHNDDLLAPGGGYPDHPHTDLEIVTWVLEGGLVHTDSTGTRTVVRPGTVQVLGAGSGIRHSEIGDGPTRFLQAWVRPDEPGLAPRQVLADAGLQTGALVPVAGGAGGPEVRTAGAALHVALLRAGDVVELPDAPRLHVFAATAAARVEDDLLGPGDALRVEDEPELTVRAETDGELLVWSFGS
jgi:redox-sensitive bicupin YhaK (pirin superfamily)